MKSIALCILFLTNSFICIPLFANAQPTLGAEPNSTAQANTHLTTAKIAGFTITANSLSRDSEKGLVQLDGDVQIIYQNQHFKADQVEINTKKKMAHLKGRVQIQSIDYEIGGDEINLDYLSNQAMIINGYVQSNNIRFQGALIEQRGVNSFFVVNANYTTCTNCPSTWSFNSHQIKAELGGYAFLKNTFLEVSGVPLFWLPYLIVPLKNERQTGFLFPEFGYIPNRNLTLSESFFWAISPSSDATFTLKNYELGGLKQLIEYRYALTNFSFGQINVSNFNDKVFSSDGLLNDYRQIDKKNTQFQRWSAQGYAQHEINPNTHGRFKLNLISDLQYPKEFYDEFKNYADGGLENGFSISHNTQNSLYQMNTYYYKHLLTSNPISPNDSAVHKLPELKFDSTLYKLNDLPLYVGTTFQFDTFYRDKKWDDLSYSSSYSQKYATNDTLDPRCDNNTRLECLTQTDNIYNENNDLLRTGKRLNSQINLTTTAFTPADSITLSPKASYNLTNYFFDEGTQRYNSRQFVKFDIASRSRFYNIYESETHNLKYKHEFIPELVYTNIPWVEQNAHPFFGNIAHGEKPFSSRNNLSDSDFNNQYGVQYDYNDRIYDRHLVTLTLLNRVIKKRLPDNTYENTLDFRLSQSYDIYQVQQSKDGSKEPLSDLSGTLTYLNESFTLTNQFNYYPYISATNSSTSISYLNDKQQYFKIGYNSKRTEEPRTDDILLALGFVTKYINVLSGFVIDTSENRSSDSRLKQFSMIAQLKPPGECWAINLYRDQKVGTQSAEIKVRFVFSFDGKPPKVIPPDELKIK